MSKQLCSHCGQEIKNAHKEVLNKHKLVMLKAAAQRVMETMSNDFKKADLREIMGDHSHYANFQKLRYHGMITPVRIEGQRIKGRWLITRNGWAFLRGEISLPAYVLVKNNHIESHAEQLVHFRDLWRGEALVATQFEYFDDAGNPVGLRPSTPRNPQMSML